MSFPIKQRSFSNLRRPGTNARKEPDPVATPIDPVDQAMQIAAVGMPALLTPKQASAILGVAERTLERWRIVGEGPEFLKLSRSTVRYSGEALTRFIGGCVRHNTAQ
jgi:hypothetical protein